MSPSQFPTADLCDRFLPDRGGIEVLAPGFVSFGGRRRYSGQVATLAGAGDGAPSLKEALAQPGHGRVLVADVGACAAWAVLGDQLAALGLRSGWAGVVLNGYVRDSVQLAALDFGVHALGTMPARPRDFAPGRHGLPLHFGGAAFVPGSWLYADEDGIVVCRARQLPASTSDDGCAA